MNFTVPCTSPPAARLWQSENWSVPHPPAQGSHRCPASHVSPEQATTSVHLTPPQPMPNPACDCCLCPLPPSPAKCHSHTLHHARTGKGISHQHPLGVCVSYRRPHCSVTIPRAGRLRAGLSPKETRREEPAGHGQVMCYPRKHKLQEHTAQPQLLRPRRLLPRNPAPDGMVGLES